MACQSFERRAAAVLNWLVDSLFALSVGTVFSA